METLDTNKHVFQSNKRGNRFLLLITAGCVLLIGVFVYLIIYMHPMVLTVRKAIFLALIIWYILCIIINLISAWTGSCYAAHTKLQIDPISHRFVYTHDGKTIEFNGSDVETWYDNIGLKIGGGKLTRLTEHDSVFILKTGEVLYLHAWLWDGDYSWLHTGNSWQNNIKFYLEAHREQLELPECKSAWTYRYIFAS